jgi:membrane protein implicated in regulation of membrane protease activity
MDTSTWWWILAGGLVIAELLTGTVYLLMIALGFAAGALAAHAGLSLPLQITVAAVIGVIGTLVWHFKRAKVDPAPHATLNADVNQDIGATVQVDRWATDGSAQVSYRGAQWTVIAATGAEQRAGAYRVKQVVGNRLVVEPV